MRTRVVKDRAKRRSYLEVRLGRREEFDLDRIRMLQSLRCRTLLTPSTFKEDDGVETLRFEVTGLMPLHGFLHRDVLSHQTYERLLASVAELVGACQVAGVGLETLLLDDREVFVSFDGMLHVASVPLVGGGSVSRTTVMGLVGLLGNTRRLKFNLEEDERIALEIGRFHDESDDFNLESYCQLLSKEFGVVQRTLLNPHIVKNGAINPTGPNRTWNGEERIARSRSATPTEAVPVSPTICRNENGWAPDQSRSAYGADWGEKSEGRDRGNSSDADVDSSDELLLKTNDCVLVRLNTDERFSLPMDEPLTLGRSDSCSVQLLGNPDMSRRQATVVCEEDGCTVCDLGSANGTTVRGHLLGKSESAKVSWGETFQLAGEPFAIVREGPNR